MSNCFYELFQENWSKLEEMGFDHKAKKLKGAMMVELLSQSIQKFLLENNEPFKVSAMNSYIAGSNSEYDLLIVKKNAEPYINLVYHPDDVVAVIESKAGGLYDIVKNTDDIANAANAALILNSNISFGYITIGENVPVNDVDPKTGKSHINHWNDTYKFLKEKIHGKCQPYAVTLHHGRKNVFDEGSDEEFEDFIRFLIGKSNI